MNFKFLFSYTPALLNGLTRAERAYGAIEALSDFEKREDSPLEFSIGQMLSNVSLGSPKGLLFYKRGFAKALEWINRPIDQTLIFELHQQLFEEVARDRSLIGRYRTEESCFYNRATEKVIEVFAPPFEIPLLMNELTEWLKEEKTLHPFLRSALFFYRFCKIHPFSDGNGRLAQLLASAILHQSGYLFKDFFALGEHYLADPEAYNQAIARKEDLTDWFVYFLKGFATQLEETKTLLVATYRRSLRFDTDPIKKKFVFQLPT